MHIFLSKYINKVDKKGRVSVPSDYRNQLNNEQFNGIIIYPSFRNNSIEVCSISHLKHLTKLVQKLDPYSDERDAFETIILGEAVQLPFDSEGRVILPTYLMQQTSITDKACFVGKGAVFEIWNPDNFAKHRHEAKIIAQNNRSILKNNFDLH